MFLGQPRLHRDCQLPNESGFLGKTHQCFGQVRVWRGEKAKRFLKEYLENIFLEYLVWAL